GRAELRIRLDKVFREQPAISQSGSRETGKKAALRVRLVTGRCGGIECATESQGVQRGGQRRIVSIREVRSRVGKRSQLGGSGLSDTINGGAANRAESGSGNVQPLEH